MIYLCYFYRAYSSCQTCCAWICLWCLDS